MDFRIDLPPPPPPPPAPKVYAEHWTRIGEGIKALRNSRGLTQEQLAKLVDVERTSITNIEKGKQRLTLDLLDKLANALGMQLVMRLEPIGSPPVAEALLGPPTGSKEWEEWIDAAVDPKELERAVLHLKSLEDAVRRGATLQWRVKGSEWITPRTRETMLFILAHDPTREYRIKPADGGQTPDGVQR